MPERVEAEFMYGVLDYETWNLYWGDQWVAQVTINTTDKCVTLTLSEDQVDTYKLRRIGNLASWVTYLKTHARPRSH